MRLRDAWALDGGRRPTTTARRGVLPAGAEDLLHHLAAEAAQRLGAPIGLVTAVTEDGTFLPGQHGLSDWPAALGAVPTQWAFCAETVRTGRAHLVADTGLDERYRTNPLVRQFGWVSPAGVPVHHADGSPRGAVCVFDTRARTFTDEDVAALRALAERAERAEHALRPLPAARRASARA